MKKNYILSSFLIFLLLGSLTSCLKNGLNKAEIDPPMSNEFDFATTKQLPITLDLGLTDYAVSVEFYAENPVKEVIMGEYSSYVKSETLKPILRSITEKDGTLNDIINIPTGQKTLYLYSNYIGLPLVTPIEIKNGAVVFSVKDNKSKSSETRAMTRAGRAVPAGVRVLGDWGANGIPDYLTSTRNHYPAEALYNLNKAVFYTATGGFTGTKYLSDNFDTNINVTKPTTVNVSYLGGSASMLNTLCYYHYPANKKPTKPEDAKLIIVFPNSTFPSTTQSGLSSGDNMMLKYWNDETNRFEDNFPAGEVISFAILPSSFKRETGDIIPLNAASRFFSQPELNVKEDEGTRSHCILFNDAKNDCYTFMFEDLLRKGSFKEGFPGGDFRDAMFYVKAGVSDAISGDNIPNLPDAGLTTPDESDNFTEAEGTLIFEDLWPSEGDYDMNDLVIEYSSKIYRNTRNRVVKIVDEFTPVHNGGYVPISFGYEFSNSNRTQLSSVIEPALTSPSVFAIEASGFELRQNKATVIVFENIKTSIGKTFTITTSCLFPQEYSAFTPPYNPFIIKNISGKRGTAEVHLTGQAPTSLADINLFGTGDDKSNITDGKYYISKNGNFPFAINIPIRNFVKTTEGVRIDKVYPKFTEWVNSMGQESTDWYIK